MTNDHYVNPFDDERHAFLVLVNAAGQFSLWPGFAAIPEGWDAVFGPAGRAACLDRIEADWSGPTTATLTATLTAAA